VKVFSATLAGERAVLGDRVSSWLAANRDIEIVAICVTQSSDSRFHCYTLTLFFMRRP
jgi:hypothetical protein